MPGIRPGKATAEYELGELEAAAATCREGLRRDPKFKALVDRIALKKLGTAQDIANGVLFFASDLGSFVNGQILQVDGGR